MRKPELALPTPLLLVQVRKMIERPRAPPREFKLPAPSHPRGIAGASTFLHLRSGRRVGVNVQATLVLCDGQRRKFDFICRLGYPKEGLELRYFCTYARMEIRRSATTS